MNAFLCSAGITTTGACWRLAHRVAELRALLQRGIERGELRPDLDTEIAIDLLLGPIYYRLLMSGEPLTSAFIDRLVAAVMTYGQ